MLKEFLKYYKPHLRLFVIDMGTAVILAFCGVAIPAVTYKIFNVYLKDRHLEMIYVSLAVWAVFIALETLCDYVNIKWGHTLGVRMEADMRRDMFAHLQKLSFSYFDRTKTGHIMSRISNDLTMIAESAHHCPEDFLISIVTIFGAFAVMMFVNPLLGAITFVPLPFIILWGTIFQCRMKERFRETRKAVANVNSGVENSIQGIREVQSYVNENTEIEKFHVVNKRFTDARENVFGTLAGFHSGIMFLLQTYSALFVGAGAVMIYYDRATVPQLLMFLMYSRFITMPIFRLVGFAEQFQQGITAFERFREVMDEKPDIEDRENALDRKDIKGEIEFKNVYFRYDDQEEGQDWVLNDINLKATVGRTVALVGESGAGKSTIAALIPRFYEVNRGAVMLDGRNVMDLKKECLRTNIGVVQQTPFLFDSTISENILFGKPEASEEELIAAAKNANIYDFIMSLPEQFNAAVGEQGVKLSGGQKQRISIARVFLKNPKVLIFDEATSSLDNESEQLIRQSMEKLCEGRTTIIIAHRLSTVRNADYIYCIKNGKIVETGTHKELLKKDGYYKKLYSMHAL
ncbi:MAG: ABC transporter ATP-binding protein [Victivallaceae bacterium]|nr:ABC transporter ATP-binding protein [Victivallaceae bacterium]